MADVNKTINVTLTSSMVVFRVMVLSFLAFTAIIGNFFVLYLFYNYPSIRLPMNYFLFNLAISDIITVFCRESFSIITIIYQVWPFDHVTCEMSAAFRSIPYIVTVYTLLAMAICRYLAIVHNKGKKVTQKVVLIIISFIWIYAIFDSILPIIGWNRYKFEYLELICIVDWTYELAYPLYIMIVDLMIPIMASILFYLAIHIHIKKSTKNLISPIFASSSGSQQQLGMYQRHILKEIRLTKTMFAVYIAFVACFVPYSILIFIAFPLNMFSPSRDLLFITGCIVDFNSSLNPVLYPVVSKPFKDLYKRVLFSNCHKESI